MQLTKRIIIMLKLKNINCTDYYDGVFTYDRQKLVFQIQGRDYEKGYW